jgi:Icc-related predicted phosphoesterase
LTDCRLFFATDIHGSDICFRKFLNAASAYEANVLILGGDITGKQLVPIIHQSGRWTASEGGEDHILETERELHDFLRRVRAIGAYPVEVTVEEVETLRSDQAYRDDCFRRAMLESVSSWAMLAEERLRPRGTRCFISLGNDDDPAVAEVLAASTWVEYPEGELQSVDGHEMVSWGWSNRTPWDSPREQDEGELEAAVSGLASELADPLTAIFNLHCPPWRSSLDVAPALDREFRPVVRGAQMEMIPVGSTGVRAAIERFQPLIGLHGHVHDSRGAKRIGRSMCFNPGSDYQHGVLRGLVVQLSDQKLKGWAFTTG